MYDSMQGFLVDALGQAKEKGVDQLWTKPDRKAIVLEGPTTVRVAEGDNRTISVKVNDLLGVFTVLEVDKYTQDEFSNTRPEIYSDFQAYFLGKLIREFGGVDALKAALEAK